MERISNERKSSIDISVCRRWGRKALGFVEGASKNEKVGENWEGNLERGKKKVIIGNLREVFSYFNFN